MSADTAFHLLADAALESAGENAGARLAMYDAMVVLAKRMALFEEAQEAAATVAALRGAETQELDFRRRIADRAKGPRP